jgi:hypothetical protein
MESKGVRGCRYSLEVAELQVQDVGPLADVDVMVLADTWLKCRL